LYLYIYVALPALLEVHTNPKRFQCEKPREKRTGLRERKEALGSIQFIRWFVSEEGVGPKANQSINQSSLRVLITALTRTQRGLQEQEYKHER